MDNIHTDAQVLGIGLNVGHVDFYPNKGQAQPPCEGSNPPISGEYATPKLGQVSSCLIHPPGAARERVFLLPSLTHSVVSSSI